MRRRAKLAAVILTFAFSAITLFAQEPRTNSKGNHAGHSTTQPVVSAPAPPSKPGQNNRLSIGVVTTPASNPNPFNRPIHLPGGGGCHRCGYGYYNGYGYGGYGYGYGGYVGDLTNPAGPTATDRILANGGTFNNINDTPESQSYAPQQQQQQPIYIRPEYSTQYSDNSTINTPIVNDQASATSDSPAILKFKDGTEMTIRNYAVFGANIVVLTPERHKYPISTIDVAATQKANEAAGYELHLPAVFTSH